MEEFKDKPCQIASPPRQNNAEIPSHDIASGSACTVSENVAEGNEVSDPADVIDVPALIAECRMLIELSDMLILLFGFHRLTVLWNRILFPAQMFSEDYTELPTSGEEAFSLHMMGRIDDSLLDGIDKQLYLSSTDTVERLKAGVDALHEMHRQHIAHTTSEGIFRSVISNIAYAVRRVRRGSNVVEGHVTDDSESNSAQIVEPNTPVTESVEIFEPPDIVIERGETSELVEVMVANPANNDHATEIIESSDNVIL